MIEIGRICLKIAGRDAGKTCVVVDTLDKTFVLIDGQTRRRKVNRSHLEPLAQTVKIAKGASSEQVADALNKAGIEVKAKKPKTEKPAKKKASAEPKA